MSQSHTKPTIILVQGSFQLPEVYNKLATALRTKHYHVIHPRLPTLTGQSEPDFASKDLRTDASTVQDVLKYLIAKEEKQVVILMHSYGGLVSIEAMPEELSWNKRASLGLTGGVIHLFYFAAFIISRGQSVLTAFGESPNNNVKPGGHFSMRNAAKLIYSDLPTDEAEYWQSMIIDQSYAVQTTEITQVAY
ncbi:hypothetical protein F4777DRAFT_559971 [Nemania sp. FL0916]|nr:hypothetical protein F4777DRAFT_559971 [Nemania sp. FL0916]